jgi:hypothetical protein
MRWLCWGGLRGRRGESERRWMEGGWEMDGPGNGYRGLETLNARGGGMVYSIKRSIL